MHRLMSGKYRVSIEDPGYPKMKAISLIFVLLVLMWGCASTEAGKFDPSFAYGGSYQVRGTVSQGVGE